MCSAAGMLLTPLFPPSGVIGWRLLSCVAAGLAVVAIVAVATMPDAEGRHETWDGKKHFDPPEGRDQSHWRWEYHWRLYDILGTIHNRYTTTYIDPVHLPGMFARVVEHGYVPYVYVFMPNQNGTTASVPLSNASAYTTAVIANASGTDPCPRADRSASCLLYTSPSPRD